MMDNFQFHLCIVKDRWAEELQNRPNETPTRKENVEHPRKLEKAWKTKCTREIGSSGLGSF